MATGETSVKPIKWTEMKRHIILHLDPSDKEGVEELFREGSKIRIMAIGETGVGKSTLLNGLIGKTIFEAGRKTKQAVTKHVTPYEHHTEDGAQIIVIDCPGLLDGSGNEDEYIQEMNKNIQVYDGIDLILYCRRMDSTRAHTNVDMQIITKLTKDLTLGQGMWQHTLFVLTFGNVYEKTLRRGKPRDVNKDFKKREQEWKNILQEVMMKCNVECNVKVCAAGDELSQQLCGEQYWLSTFWASACEVLDECGKLALLRLTSSRFRHESDVALDTEAFKTTIEKQPIILTDRVKKALGITATGGAFAAGGAALGATIGAVFIGVISFGPAAGAGLVIGGFIGATVGSTLGGAIVHLYERRKSKKDQAQKDRATGPEETYHHK